MNAVISEPYVIEHVIAAREVGTRAMCLISHLVAAGLDPCGLDEEDFVPVVLRMEVTDWIGRAINHGVIDLIHGDPFWYRSDHGDAHLVFTFETQTSGAAFKLLMV